MEDREGGPPAPVELRIHGVGGSTREALLGQGRADETVLVAGGDPSGVWARRSDPAVRGYVWGPLTSGSRLQPLWVVLLPFTVLNVAGWMHGPVEAGPAAEGGPRGRRGSRGRAWLVRALVTVLGYSLTVTWVLWLCVILADLVAYRAGRDLPVLGGSDGWRGTAGVAAAAVAMAAVFAVAGRSRRRFERSPETEGVEAPRRRLDDDEALDSPSFFAHPDDSGWLLRGHGLVAAATAAVAVAWVWKRVVLDEAGTLSFGALFVTVGGAQLAGLAALVLASLGERGRLDRRWRVAGPGVAATIGLMLSNGVFAGVALWVRHRLDAGRVPVVRGSERLVDAPLGAELALLDVFVASLLLLGLGVAASLGFFLWPRAADAPDAPPDWRRRVARRRRLSRAFRHVDIPLTAWALTLLAAGGAVAVARLDRLEGCSGLCLSLDPDRGGVAFLRTLGEWVLPLAALATSALVRLGLRSARARRNVGNLWDVLTFWPRRFHPLGVRPYAERAVPELQRHVEACLDEGRPVVVSAHSQGSLLGFAALCGLPDRSRLRRVALVTYGSPLGRLHARFFPHYFSPPLVRGLRADLLDGENGWRNFYRRTDHIGQRVFEDVPEAAVHDVVLADPAVDAPVEDPGDAPGEPDLVPLTTLAGHNFYRRERRLKDWVKDLKGRLAGAGEGAVGGPPPP